MSAPWDAAEDGPIRLALLGSTGSIGRQALDLVRAHPSRFKVVALAAGSDWEGLQAQAKEFEVPAIGIASGPEDAPEGIRLFSGPDAAAQIAAEPGAHIVLNALVGAAGLHASLATIASEKILALANKESLVAAGELIMAKVAPGQLRPVDSEHSAMWQLLEGLSPDQVRKAYLMGSGGPFRGKTTSELAQATVADAMNHPVWEMGPKITVDSATLMNKGLEVIEAHFLFGFTYDEIEVVIQPQGMVHAMVETFDGAVFSHAAPPDMRLPIQLALTWPERLSAPGALRIDWQAQHCMTFEPPDTQAFPCLGLAIEAGRRGDCSPAVLNAANEIAVRGFIEGKIRFVDIAGVIEQVLEEHSPSAPVLEAVMEADHWSRSRATELLTSLNRVS